ncbi:MAG TPA: phosphatase PAP2 family protein [Verrucomicrobiales bacterium]|nr:phosphatase PAP2 family protein [Verrucomicrobiales bacterium]
MQRHRFSLASLIFFGLCASAFGDLVTDWNNALLDAIRTERTNPPWASRGMAMTHLAIYDAANGIQRTHRPYHVQEMAPEGSSIEAAISAAANRVLSSLFPNPDTQAAHFTPLYDSSLAAIPDGPPKTGGIAWGEMTADAMLALRANDGSNDIVEYTPSADPGRWRPTPPGFASALLPNWGLVVPFAVTDAALVRPQTPPQLDTAAYSYEFNTVKNYGGVVSALRTEDQSEVADFWADNPGTATPPGHWNVIAQDVGAVQGASLAENARLFALLGMAVADAAIAAWDCKFVYDYWRPVTAIREADTDGNPETEADPEWSSYIPTPPFPEYTSGHSTFSRSAATVLAGFFGSDDITFTTQSDGLSGVIRTYHSFGAAADDAGISRIFGGIHWPSGNLHAQASGYAIGHHVLAYFLQPLDALQFTSIRREGSATELEFTGTPDTDYTIQASNDLETWETLATLSSSTGIIVFQDINAPLARTRFYQATPHE